MMHLLTRMGRAMETRGFDVSAADSVQAAEAIIKNQRPLMHWWICVWVM